MFTITSAMTSKRDCLGVVRRVKSRKVQDSVKQYEIASKVRLELHGENEHNWSVDTLKNSDHSESVH